MVLWDKRVERGKLTICRASGLSVTTSSSRSQQERMWRNQSPIFSLKLLLEDVVDIVRSKIAGISALI